MNDKLVGRRGPKVPKTAPKFDDSLVLPPGTQPRVILVTMIYYGKKIQSKTSKGKRHVGQNPEETRHGLPEFSPRKSRGTHLAPPAMSCDNTCQMLPTTQAR